MSEDLSTRPPRVTETPPDSRYEYTSPVERFGGAAVDVIFLHIILIPFQVPAADYAFRLGAIWPPVLFLVGYFGFLLLWLHFKGLTPGGVPLKYRVRDDGMNFLSWGRGLRRLAPYILIQLVALWRLQVVLNEFGATGEAYELDQMLDLIKTHGGFWNVIVVALNGFVLIDLLFLIQSPRNQSLSDRLAGSFVLSRSTS